MSRRQPEFNRSFPPNKRISLTDFPEPEQPILRPYPPGTIGILTTEHSRYSRFWTSMLSLEIPNMTKLIVKMSLSIPEARNQVLEEASGDWVWFIDDDHTFEPDLLRKLLQREVDIIQPLVLTRYTPFAPVVMGPAAKGMEGSYWRYGLDNTERDGLKKVSIAGCAGMLIRRRVWETVPKPWFRMGEQQVAEDVGFCAAAGAAGFNVWCDLDNRMGHLNVGEVWPELTPDGWVTRLKFGQQTMHIPKANAKYVVNNKTGEIVEKLPTAAENDTMDSGAKRLPLDETPRL